MTVLHRTRRLSATLAKWTLLGAAIGVLAGLASTIFLFSLDWATRFRDAHPAIILALPAAGALLGFAYQRFAGDAAQGNHLVIEEIHSNQSRIPRRMAPMILLGTVATHLFGGSAGREGTALQMGAALADALRQALRLDRHDRRLLLMAGISGGFGSVFGTPVAGFVFGMEVQALGRIRYEGLVPCLVAACVGDLTARALGVPHAHYPLLPSTLIEPLLLAKIALAGLACGLVARAFIELTHAVKHLAERISRPWLRPAAGGFALLALTALVGSRDYLGLSLPLAARAVHGEDVVLWAFALKLVFTALTLGSGFLGGEVTPLFVIGATLGHALGRLLGVDPAFMAALGFVAVFAGASNTPLACVLMGVELFGGGALVYSLTLCAVAYLASGHRSIYRTQRIDTVKVTTDD
jgi:H+/Cl- antiporter ClcA